MFVGGAVCEALGAFLAAALLRFQRVERAQEEREAELHALPSGGVRFGPESQGLDMEQLPVLLGERQGVVPRPILTGSTRKLLNQS